VSKHVATRDFTSLTMIVYRVRLKAGMKKTKAGQVAGLIKNWKKPSQPIKRPSQKEAHPVQALGGLDDTDASATKPKSVKATKSVRLVFNPSMIRDSSRQNEVWNELQLGT
jgi:hypothetical protein